MNFVKRNYGWIIVTILAILPLIIVFGMINIDLSDGLSITFDKGPGSESTLDMLYHVTGEFAIRWMTLVLSCTPFFIIFGVTNLYVRQAMGISTAIWSFLHFIIFLLAEGFIETFTQVNYVVGLIAILILIPLFFTSNRKSMKRLRTGWKKLQTFSYAAIFLSLLHVAILDKAWLFYTIIVGLGFIIRIPAIKHKLIAFRTQSAKP